MFRALVTLAAFAAAIIATTGMVAHAQCLGMSCYGSGPYGYHDRGSDHDAPPRHYRPYRPRYDSRPGVWIALTGATQCGTGSANPLGEI